MVKWKLMKILQPAWTLHTLCSVKLTFNHWKRLHEVNKAVKFIETENGEPQWEAKSKDHMFMWGYKSYPGSRIAEKTKATQRESKKRTGSGERGGKEEWWDAGFVMNE